MKRYSKMLDSKIEWIGEIPAHWKLKKLKFATSLISNNTSEKSEDLPYIGLENVGSGTGRLLNINCKKVKGGSKSCFEPGNVLFGKLRPYLAKAFLADFAGVCSGEFLVLQSQEFRPKFLLFLFLSDRYIQTVDSSTYGAKMPRADWSFIGNIAVPVPTNDEQDNISTSLDAKTKQIDSEIKKNQELIELLREKQQATINQAITRGLDPSIPTKDSKINWIGDIPKNWDVLKFLSMLEKKEKRNDDNAQRKMLSVSQYFGIIVKEYESKVLTKSKEESRRYFIVEPDDLVVNVMWLHYRGLAVSAIEGIVSPDYHVYKINSTIINPQFLNYLVRSDIYLNEYPRHLRGIRPNSSRISEHDFKRLPLLLPSLGEQKQISEFLKNVNSNIDSLIKKIQFQDRQLEEYRQTLISTVVTGKIDVRQEVIV